MKAFLYKFSIFTIFIALIHFTLETLFTIKFGQTIAGYLPDLIAVALLITAGYLTIKDTSAIGILCGAWGFAFCLHYRSWAWRFDDVIDGIILSMKSTSGICNIASGNGTSIGNLAKLFIQLSGKSSKIIHKSARKGEIIYSVANIDKSNKELGFYPKISLDVGLNTL